MATPTRDPGRAELWLISDFPSDDAQFAQVRLLVGEATTNSLLQFSIDDGG